MLFKPFKQWLKHYLDFSRKDRSAIITLSVLIFIVLIGHIIANNVEVKSELDQNKAEKLMAQWNQIQDDNSIPQYLFEFNPNQITLQQLDSLLIPRFVKRNIISYRNAGGTFKRKSDIRKIYGMNDSIFSHLEDYIIIPGVASKKVKQEYASFEKIEKTYTGYFDPNRTTMDSLLGFGFNRYQAENLIKYRQKGGVFYSPKDILKIYGVDSSFFYSIEKNIKIYKKEIKNSKPKKEIEFKKVDLNSADSAKLVLLNGVGPVFASRIVKFRNLLGGYYAKKQLLEVYHFPEETYNNIEKYLELDTMAIHKIRINFADFGEMLRHPYLKKNQVEKIVTYRDNQGSFLSLNELLQNDVLDVSTFHKVKPYLTCR